MLQRRKPRRVQRYPVRWAVGEINGRPSPDVLVVDISSLGARLEASQPLAPRQPVHFTVRYPGDDKETRLSGQIVWTHPVAAAPGRFWIGLQFFTPRWEVERMAREGKLTPAYDK